MKRIKPILLFTSLSMLFTSCGGNSPDPIIPPVPVDDHHVVFDFNNPEELVKKGVKLDTVSRNAGKEKEIVIKDGKMILDNDLYLGIIGRIESELTNNVWIRKVTFTVLEGADKYAPEEESEKQRFHDNVWEDKTSIRTDLGVGGLFFKGTGKVVIDKIEVDTADFKPYTTQLSFSGIDEDEKIYILGGSTQVDYDARKEFKSDMIFPINETVNFLIERNARHKKYYGFPDAAAPEGFAPIRTVDATFEDPKTGEQIVTKVYQLSIIDDITLKNVPVSFTWTGVSAYNALKVDTTSAIKYVKGFMETKALDSIDIRPGDAIYGGTIKMIGLRAKSGYHDLKVYVNGVEAKVDYSKETPSYSFVVPEKDEIIISFKASEGDPVTPGVDKLVVSEKGYLLVGKNEEGRFLAFNAALDHPSATLKSIKFKGEELTPIVQEEGTAYKLSDEQNKEYEASSDKLSLFTVEITESGIFDTSIRINTGSFVSKVEESKDGGATYSEVSISDSLYHVKGNSKIRLSFTPNENLEMFAIERNDVRLVKGTDYLVNELGVATYVFDASRSEYEFLVQTINQKVVLTANISEGYKIEGLTSEPVNVGEPVSYKLAGNDDEHSLFDKNIVITYNGANVPFNEQDYSFTLIPVKGVSEIKVVITEK